MSNIGNTCIYIPKNISCEIKSLNNQNFLWVSGDFGIWSLKIPYVLKITLTQNYLSLNMPEVMKKVGEFLPQESKKLNTVFSLTTVHIQKMFHAASVGFKRYLRVKGVGYKFVLDQHNLQIHVGLSHLLESKLHPEFLIKTTRKLRMMRLRSKSLVTLSNTVASLRNLKKPNTFTGKGIRYRGDLKLRKEGKQRKTF